MCFLLSSRDCFKNTGNCLTHRRALFASARVEVDHEIDGQKPEFLPKCSDSS